MTEVVVAAAATTNFPTLLQGCDQQNILPFWSEKPGEAGKLETQTLPEAIEAASSNGDEAHMKCGKIQESSEECLEEESKVYVVEVEDRQNESLADATNHVENVADVENIADAADEMPVRPPRIIDAESEEAFWKAAQKALRERARREKVDAFLKKHRFKTVNERKGWLFSYTYPLHVAVELNDVDMARTLVKSKARKKQRDSLGHTAKQTALYLNKFGSHDEMLRVLHRPKKQVRAPQPLADDVAIDTVVLDTETGAAGTVVGATVFGKAASAAVDGKDGEISPDGI
jgi:hypothetical protein